MLGAGGRSSEAGGSKFGATARMRSSSGGCVSKKLNVLAASPSPKLQMTRLLRRGLDSRDSNFPIFHNAPAMPSGLRVYCTADRVGQELTLPAHRSLDEVAKEHADVADDVDGQPDEKDRHCERHSVLAIPVIGAPPIVHADVAKMRMTKADERATHRMPLSNPISRTLSFMSPCRMWLNSWAITP